MGHYQHLTTDERERIMILHAQGLSKRTIGKELNRSHTTISRELGRNHRFNGSYSAAWASKKYCKRRRRCHKKLIMGNKVIANYVIERLNLKWTPEQIAGRAKKDNCPFSFSFSTIYRAIDKHLLPFSPKQMRFKGVVNRKRKPDDKRGKMQGITGIDKRPKIANKRKRVGDWESDTVFGVRKTGAIGTHVDRKTGYLVAFKLKGLTSAEFVERTVEAFKQVPPEYHKTFTVDHGKEFTKHRDLARLLNMPVYFCNPCSPWQRGTNENTNGLLRQFFPKRTSFASITDEVLEYVVTLINQRPRKRLGWKTPAEVFYQGLAPKWCT